MGFFYLHVTVIVYASPADIFTTTRPFFACPPVPAICTRSWCITKSNQVDAPLIERQETFLTSKKGHRSTPEFRVGTVNSQIRYQNLTLQTLRQNHPQE